MTPTNKDLAVLFVGTLLFAAALLALTLIAVIDGAL